MMRVQAEAGRSAELANRAKREFPVTTRHEIRTPLHGTLGPSARTPVARWQRLLAMAAMAATAALAAGCGGSGGGRADLAAAMLGVVKVVVRDADGAPVAGATVKQMKDASPEFTTDAQGVVFLIARPGPVSLSIAEQTFTPVVTQATLGLDAVTTMPVTLQRASVAAADSLSTRSGVVPVRSGGCGRILDAEV